MYGLTSQWREAKKSNREENEKFEVLFSNFEKRTRNLKFLSPVSRGEREIWKKVLHFWEKKEKGVFFSQVSRGEREFCLKSPISRREIWKRVLHFREEKEKWILFSQDSRGEREFLPGVFEKFSLSAKLCQSYCDSQSFRESESFTLISLLPTSRDDLVKILSQVLLFFCYYWSLWWWLVYLHCKS